MLLSKANPCDVLTRHRTAYKFTIARTSGKIPPTPGGSGLTCFTTLTVPLPNLARGKTRGALFTRGLEEIEFFVQGGLELVPRESRGLGN
jgi:hypothetical protein